MDGSGDGARHRQGQQRGAEIWGQEWVARQGAPCQMVPCPWVVRAAIASQRARFALCARLREIKRQWTSRKQSCERAPLPTHPLSCGGGPMPIGPGASAADDIFKMVWGKGPWDNDVQ